MKYFAQYICLVLLLTLTQCTPKNANKTMTTQNKTAVDNTVSQDFRKSAPKPGPAPEIHIGDFSNFTLDNGLKVIVVENHQRPLVSYSIRIDRDPILQGDKAGYIGIAGQLLESGTTHRTKAEIDEDIDFIGGSLSTSGTHVSGQSLTKFSEQLLDLMQDILLNPSFPEDEFQKIKKQMISGIAAQMANPNAISSNISDMVVYGKDFPYGEFPTKESIENITLEDVKNYYNTYFKPNISYLIIVGDISVEKARKQAQKYFGNWEKSDVPEHQYTLPQAPETRKVVFVDKPGAVQSVIKVAYPVELHLGDDDYLAAKLMNTILGGGTFSGYLMQNLREDKGYTYGARSQLSADELVGKFVAYASVRNEVTDSSVVEFLRELNRIKSQKVDKAHLQLAKNAMIGRFSRSLESPSTVAMQAYNIFKYNLPKDYYQTYLQRLSKVSIEDVYAAAQKYIKPEHAYITVVGNKKAVADKLKHFSGTQSIDFYTPTGEKVQKIDKEIPYGLRPAKVLDDYTSAIGGHIPVFRINTVLRESELHMMGRTFKAVEMVVQPNKYKQVIKMNGQVIQEAVYNDSIGILKSMRGTKKMTEDDLRTYRRKANLFLENKYDQYGSYEKWGAKLELVSYAMVDGEEAYKMKITYKDGDIQYDYYSTETGLKLMESRTVEGPGGKKVVVKTKFKDYRKVNDVLFPFKVITEGLTPTPMIIETTKLIANYDFEDGTFNVEE